MAITYNIQIGKARVMDEVRKTTEYIGSKSVSEQDPGAYERITAVDANREQLDRYWTEACDGATRALAHWVESVRSQSLTHHPEIGSDRDYLVKLAMPTNWDNAYLPVVNETLLSYLVNSIVAKWLLIVQPDQASAYATLAAGGELQLGQMMLYRKRPTPRRSGPNTDDGLWHRADIWHRDDLW